MQHNEWVQICPGFHSEENKGRRALTHVQVITRVVLTFTCCGGIVHDLWVLPTEPSEKARHSHDELDNDPRLTAHGIADTTLFAEGVMVLELAAFKVPIKTR